MHKPKFWQLRQQTPGQILHKIKQLDSIRVVTAMWLTIMFWLLIVPFFELWVDAISSWSHRQVNWAMLISLGTALILLMMYRVSITAIKNYGTFKNKGKSQMDAGIELGLYPLAQMTNSAFSLMFWTGLAANLNQMSGLVAVTFGWVVFNGVDWAISYLQHALNRQLQHKK